MIDADARTLHVRCGSDIRDSLRVAGFTGYFLEYSDPICQGPVPDGPDLLTRRAGFLEAAYGWFKQQTAAQFLAGLEEAERALAASASEYQRVVLWFEHDSYDQLILARILAHFGDAARPARLELICIDHHPSVARFVGLGQLEPAALAALWPERHVVTSAQFDLGRAVWAALRQPDPSALAAIASGGTPALPVMAGALRRHLQELPGVTDGLSLTERQVLRILADAPTTIGRIFAAFQHSVEPLPFLGDIGVMGVVEHMAMIEPPVLTIAAGEAPFPRVATITDIGRAVLDGAVDYLSLRPAERWIGGVAADGGWRWDERAGGVVRAIEEI